DASQGEAATCGRSRFEAEIAIRRKAAPVLVAAVEQIEADRAGHDRNDRAPNIEAAALFGKPRLHAASCLQSKCRTARQRDRVDLLHGVGDIEQGPLAGAGAAA